MAIGPSTKLGAGALAAALGAALAANEPAMKIDQSELRTVGLQITPKVIQTNEAVYPLHNLTAVRVQRLIFTKPSKRIAALIGFITFVITSFLLGSVLAQFGTEAMNMGGFLSLILGIIASLYWYQSRCARIPELYALIAESPGSITRVVTSMNAHALHQALHCIIESLEANLASAVTFNISDSVITDSMRGDKISTFGEGSIGKQYASS